MLKNHLKKVVSALLCLVMLAGLIPCASAASDIGLYASDPKAGSGRISISWSSVPNVQFYAYSVRNTTTNELLADREQTSRTSASVSDDFVTGHSYRVWAGACCEGNDPSDTSTWDYTGQVVVSVIGCAHSETDVAWDTNYKINYKEVSDTKHEMSGYMYEYCIECFERIGKSYKATKKYEHDYDSNGDCPSCGYTAECPHDRTKLVEKKGYPSYKQDDEEEHIVDIQYERVCRDCDDVIENVVDSAREYYREPHNFNSKGVCRNCNFVKPEKQEPLTLSVSSNQSSAEAGATISATASAAGGTGKYNYAWVVTCNGSTIAETDFGYGSYYSVTASKEGTYVFKAYVKDGNGSQVSASSGSITVTPPPCPHTNREVAWDTNYSISYKIVSDTEHSMSGYMYEYCTECFEHVGSSYKATKNYKHDFDAAGDCPSCGYTRACKHTSTYYEPIPGYPSYEPYNEKEHIYDVQYSEYCANPECGKQLKYIVDEVRVYEHQPHRFAANGTCSDCGFVKPEDQKPLTLSVSNAQSTAETGSTIRASAYAEGGTGDYDYAWVVTRNGSTIAETDFSHGSSYSVSAMKEGTYVFKAYVKDSNGNQVSASGSSITVTSKSCPHTNRDVSWDTNYSINYKIVSDTEHSMSGYMYEYCTECFERVGSSYQATKNYKHDFDAAGDCPSCGYTRSCKHQTTYYEPRPGYPSYEPHNADKHIYDLQYSKCCAACGKVVKQIADEARVYEYRAHRFGTNGTCVDCGYVKAEAQKPLTLSISNSQSTAEVGTTIGATANAAGGSGDYDYAWVVTCNGSTIAETDFSYGSYYSVKATNAGTYVFKAYVQDSKGNQASASGSSIKVSEATCPHPHREVAWDTYYTIKYESVSDTEHSMSGYMYEYCTKCLERVGSSYKATKNYKHDFNAAGDCPSCGYTHACKHTSTYFEPLPGYPSYNPYNEEEHIYDVQYSEYCANCGNQIRYIADEARVYEHQPHRFNANGACSSCGYVKTEQQEPLSVTVSAGQSTTNVGNLISASASITGGSGDYNIAWKVTMDGAVVSQTDLSMGKSYSYVADEAGSYVFTVTVKDSAGNSQTVSSSAIVVKVAHNWKTVTSTEIINQSVKIHDIVTTTFEECTICGEKTEPVVTTQSVEHVIVRTSYESAHPHQKFNVCRDCSAHPLVEGAYQTANGKVQSADKCCICHGHVWLTDEPKEVDGEWREYCANCELYRTAEAPEPEHTHSFSVNITSAKDHPHQISGYCECGEFTDFLDVYAKDVNCCQCSGHLWASVFKSGNKYIQGCTRCNYQEEVTPSAGQEAFYDVVDNFKQSSANSEAYSDKLGIDERSGRIWKVVAAQATDKLQDAGFVYTKYTLDATSDISGTISDAALKKMKLVDSKTWDEQQQEYWTEFLLELLKQETKTKNKPAEISQGANDFADIAGKIAEKADEKSFEFLDASQNAYYQENVINEWISDLDAELQKLEETKYDPDFAGSYYDRQNELSSKRAKLLEINSGNEDLAESYESKGKNYATQSKVADKVSTALEVFSIVYEGTAAIDQMNKNLDELNEILSNNIHYSIILDSIIECAGTTSNLGQAAVDLKKQFDEQSKQATNRVLAGIDVGLEKAGEQIVKMGGEKVTDAVLDAIPSYLDGVELVGKALDTIFDWDDAFNSAEKLMTLSVMDAGMNILGVSEKSENYQYYAQLWALLQAKGDEHAVQMLDEWNKGNALNMKDFGISSDHERLAAKADLSNEHQRYRILLEKLGWEGEMDVLDIWKNE